MLRATDPTVRMETAGGGKIVVMPADESRAELSSLSTMLDTVIARLAAIAEAAAKEDQAGAADLFEIERDLQSAGRRLVKLIGNLGGPAT